jgi:CSLREA domain-containing protein
VDRSSRLRTGTFALAGLVAALAAWPSLVAAATIVPDTRADQFNSDPSRCSLREAIWAANNDSDVQADGCRAGSGIDTVILRGGRYRLTISGGGEDQATGDLVLTEAMTLRAARGARPTVDATGLGDRVFEVTSPTPVRVSGLTIRGGSGGAFGAGIHVPGGVLRLSNSTVTGNSTTNIGGGVGVANGGDATLTNVTVSGNQTSDDGGGIRVTTATLRLANVTITNNAADLDATGDDGGGISVGGLVDVSVRNTIVAGNHDGSPPGSGDQPDCNGGLFTSLGHNLFGDPSGCGALQPTDLTGDPGLLPLRNNGGATLTHALRAGSQAIGLGSGCAATDQRGVPRTLGGPCDSGAYERVRCAGAVVNRVGTAGKDRLRGTARRDGILGLGGSDLLRGLAGRDGICGGRGRDRLLGGRGPDRLLGQAGADSLIGGPGADSCLGGPGRDRQRGC